VDIIDQNKLSEQILKEIEITLKAKGVDLDQSDFDDLDDLSYDLLIKLMDQPKPFIIGKNGELSVIVDSEEYVLDPKKKNANDVALQEKLLMDALPSYNIDLYYNGVRRKQQEAAAAYKVVVVSSALRGRYDDKIRQILSEYDFVNLRPNNTQGITFCEFLKEVEQDAGSVTKFLLACCTILITSKKQRTEKPYIGILADSDAEWLKGLSDFISIKEAQVSKQLESEPSKLNRLILINDKDESIRKFTQSEIKNDARKDILLKIMRLTSDSLPQDYISNIKEAVRLELRKMLHDDIIDGDTHDSLLKKVSKRAMKQAVRSMQKSKYSLFMDPSVDVSDILPKT
jgi:hypothetical protein